MYGKPNHCVIIDILCVHNTIEVLHTVAYVKNNTTNDINISMQLMKLNPKLPNCVVPNNTCERKMWNPKWQLRNGFDGVPVE